MVGASVWLKAIFATEVKRLSSGIVQALYLNFSVLDLLLFGIFMRSVVEIKIKRMYHFVF